MRGRRSRRSGRGFRVAILTAMAAPDIPTPEEVARIAAIAHPALRNLEITYGYARLSTAVAQRTGEWANWCSFGVWASRQAGTTIRGADLEAAFE